MLTSECRVVTCPDSDHSQAGVNALTEQKPPLGMVFLNVYGYKLCVPVSVSIWLLHYIVQGRQIAKLA